MDVSVNEESANAEKAGRTGNKNHMMIFICLIR